jgi:hypothetical protein
MPGSPTAPGHPGVRASARPCRLPPAVQCRHPGCVDFAARWPVCAIPCRRFALTGADARLGADVDRYSLSQWTCTTYSCGMAPSIEALQISRIVQGIGAALYSHVRPSTLDLSMKP